MERGREQCNEREKEAFSCRGCVHASAVRKVKHRNAHQDRHAPAFYMITMTTLERRPLFATCAGNKATLNEDGWLVYHLWHDMPKAYPAIATSTLVIMPDHLHGIVQVKERKTRK